MNIESVGDAHVGLGNPALHSRAASSGKRIAVLVIGLAAVARLPGNSRTQQHAIMLATGPPTPSYRMLMARAITSVPMPIDTIASTIMSSLAHGLIAEMSVGLNAVAVQKPSDR
jgi:hypothetical protein